jgi:translation initiation factor eIF-2B subunit delta
MKRKVQKTRYVPSSPLLAFFLALYHHLSFPYPHPHLLSLAFDPRSARGADYQQKEYLIKAIDSYIEVRIHLADQVIASTAREKIKAGYSVVTFARSSVVEQALMEAWDDIRENDPEASFSVVVVDSRPLNEGTSPRSFFSPYTKYSSAGLGLLQALTNHGIPCTYVLLTQSSHLIARSNLILLGGSALHSDGALYARSGTAMVAMIAKEHRVPVVACVETYKFGERVLLDGIATNELSDIGEVFELPCSTGIKEDLRGKITSLPLLYDLTPPQFVTAVCTEVS